MIMLVNYKEYCNVDYRQNIDLIIGIGTSINSYALINKCSNSYYQCIVLISFALIY